MLLFLLVRLLRGNEKNKNSFILTNFKVLVDLGLWNFVSKNKKKKRNKLSFKNLSSKKKLQK